MSVFLDKVDRMSPGQILADTKVAHFIAEMAMGIAEAQAELDMNSVDQLIKMANTKMVGSEKNLVELGLVPAFYHFQYADLEVKLQVTMTVDRTTSTTVTFGLTFEDLDAEEEAEGNVDTITLDVNQSEASPATAILELRDNSDDCEVVISDDGLDTTLGIPGNVTRGASLGATAANFAEDLEALSQIAEVKVDILPSNGLILTSTAPALRITGNEVMVLDEAPTAAVCYAGLRDLTAGTVTVTWDEDDDDNTANRDDTFELMASGATASTNEVDLLATSPESLQAIVALMNTFNGSNSGDGYEATYLVEAGRFVVFPRPPGHADVLDTAGNVTTPGLLRVNHTPLAVNFAFGGRTLDVSRKGNNLVIDEVVRFLDANPGLRIRLDGHTDDVGSVGYNSTLSDERADSVAKELHRQGIALARIDTQGLGENHGICLVSPADSSSTKDQKRELNRRVEFIVLDTDDKALRYPVMKLQADAAGASRIDLDGGNSGLRPMGVKPGQNRIELADGDTLDIETANGNTHTFTVDPAGPSTANPGFFARGASPAQSAANLTATLNSHTASGLSASATGANVVVGGQGSVARLTLTTTKVGEDANKLGIAASGVMHLISKFAGGSAAVMPPDGATVSLGSRVLTLVTDDTAKLKDREFRRGEDAEATAYNLAKQIDELTGFSAAISGSTLTITGPSGTSTATTHPEVFELSKSRIGGTIKIKSKEKKKAVAVNTAVSVTDVRKYGLEVTGNSTIKARLVSLPVPVDLLDEVKTYLSS